MIFSAIDAAKSDDELLDVLCKFFQSFGFGATCIVIPDIVDTNEYHLLERGMPPGWMEKYRQSGFAAIDPVPHFTMELGEAITLQTAMCRGTQTQSQIAYADEFSHSGVTDGLAIPTFGAHGARGFLGICQVSPKALKNTDASLMLAVARHAHARFDSLGSYNANSSPHLSPREREILCWVGAGKSNNDIATILAISLPTVATHVQRIYAKLKVHDRTSAAVVGFKLGLIG